MRLLLLLSLFSLITCGFIRDSMTFYPDTNYSIPTHKRPAFAQEKNITTSDGETLQAFHFVHNDSSKRPHIIYFHGNAGNLFHRFGTAQKLYTFGFNVLLVSYRGYAQSSGSPSEEGVYNDGLAAWQYTVDTLSVPSNQIILMGRSLGSTVAVHTAQHQKIRALVLITPLSSGAEMAQVMGLGAVSSIAGTSYDNLSKINNLQAPLLVIHGTEDHITPVEMGKKLYERYKGSKKLVIIPGAGHNNLQDVNPNLFWQSIQSLKLETNKG